MNKIIVSAICFMISVSASAQNFYVKGAIGSSSQSSNTFMGGDIDYRGHVLGSFLIAGGFNFGSFSTELEISSRTAELDYVNSTPARGEVSSLLIGFNGLFNIPIGMHHRGFIGVGWGLLGAEMTDDLTGNFADGSGLSSQFILGFETAVDPNLDVSLEYRRLSSNSLRMDGSSHAWGEKFDFRNSAVMLGLKYNF